MAFSNGQLGRFAVVWDYGGSDEQVNTWHVGIATPASDAADFEDDVKEYFAYLYSDTVAAMVDNLTHTRIEVFNVSGNNPEPWIGAEADLNGLSNNDPVPTGVCALIYARTAISRCIGKKYLPTFTEADKTGDVWAGAAITAMQGIATRWGSTYSATNGTGFRAGVYRQAVNNIQYPISVQYSLVPAYQRRRKLGRGS